MKTWPTVLAAVMLVSASLAFAQDKYGDAVLQEGAMTIVRDGDNLQFDTPEERVPIFLGDVVRMRAESRAVLESREKATLTLGSNAVFQVKPWERKEEQGFARMLYGRLRSAVSGLLGGESFNMQTPTAVIGVKGTEDDIAVSNTGDTLLLGREDQVEFTGLQGPTQVVGPDVVSVVVNGLPATPPAPIPDPVRQRFNLGAPQANAPGADSLPGEEGLVEAGIVSEGDVEEGKQEEAEEPEGPEGEGELETFENLESETSDIQEGLFRGGLELQFQQP